MHPHTYTHVHLISTEAHKPVEMYVGQWELICMSSPGITTILNPAPDMSLILPLPSDGIVLTTALPLQRSGFGPLKQIFDSKSVVFFSVTEQGSLTNGPQPGSGPRCWVMRTRIRTLRKTNTLGASI